MWYGFWCHCFVLHIYSWRSVYNCIFLYPFQINGQVLYGHSHQNASSIIKSSLSKVKIIFVRYQNTSFFLLKLLKLISMATTTSLSDNAYNENWLEKVHVLCNVVQNSIEGAIVIQQKDALEGKVLWSIFSGVRFLLMHFIEKKSISYFLIINPPPFFK